MLGAGLWGTALADHLARLGRSVRLWEFFPELARSLESSRRHPHLARLRLPGSVRVTPDMPEALEGAHAVLVVVASGHVRATARSLAGTLGERRPLMVNAAKGVEPGTLKTMGEILLGELPWARGRLFTLSGPSFAREVADGVPTKVVLAGPAGAWRRAVARCLDGRRLRVEESRDRVGVELGGSLKNVLAIGCGILDGLGAGANTKAALMAQGMAELGRLIGRRGGRSETAYGLSGLGDLIATGTSPHSRNRAFGEKLGRGVPPGRALREIPTVTEGVESARSCHALVRSLRLDAPLLEAVWRVVHRGAYPGRVVAALGF